MIVLLSSEIDEERAIPLPTVGTSVGAAVTSGFSVGTGAIVGRAGDVGFGVGADGSTHFPTVTVVASIVPFLTFIAPSES